MSRQYSELTLRECRSLGELLSASDAVKFRIHGEASPERPLPWLLSTAIPEPIRPTLAGGDRAPALGLAALTRCWIFGKMHIGNASSAYCSREIFPGYVGLWTETGRNDGLTIDVSAFDAREIDGHTVVVSHFNAGVYGHWLLECVPKLLYLRQIASMLPKYRIAVPARSGAFMSAWIRHVMPSAEIIQFDPSREYLVCEKVLLPLSLASASYDFHPLLGEMIDELVPPRDGVTEPLYITRQRGSWFRFMTNQDEIEEIARKVGFRLVSPETLSVPDQIALFARSSIIAGEFGSALHNSIFSPTGSCVLGLNWINALQSRVSRLRRQRCGFILPSSKRPLLFDSSNKERRGYHIDPEEFQRAAEEILEQSRA